MSLPVLVLDGTALTCGEVAAAARGRAQVAVGRPGRDRAAAAASAVRRVSALGEVYGRTTGVGSNRDVIVVGNDDLAGHGLRLARSHAGGAGN